MAGLLSRSAVCCGAETLRAAPSRDTAGIPDVRQGSTVPSPLDPWWGCWRNPSRIASVPDGSVRVARLLTRYGDSGRGRVRTATGMDN